MFVFQREKPLQVALLVESATSELYDFRDILYLWFPESFKTFLITFSYCLNVKTPLVQDWWRIFFGNFSPPYETQHCSNSLLFLSALSKVISWVVMVQKNATDSNCLEKPLICVGHDPWGGVPLVRKLWGAAEQAQCLWKALFYFDCTGSYYERAASWS